MPWHIENDKEGCSGFAVVKDDGGDIEGCHKTEEEAKKQLAALYANEPQRSEAAEAPEIPEEIPPRDYVVRAVYSDDDSWRAASLQEDGTTMVGYLAVWNDRAKVNSQVEGRFIERVMPGAFMKTIKENRNRMRVIYDHGQDPRFGRHPLGPIQELKEDQRGVYYEVPLLDTSNNRDLLPGLRAGVYGSSFRFRPTKMDPPVYPLRATPENPERWEERTVRELEMVEFGPTPFPYYPGATAGIRSMTDEYRSRQLGIDPDELRVHLARTALPDGGAEKPHSDEGSRTSVTYPPVSLDDFVKRLTG
jgi:HK97 family phage prohead protease